MKRATSSRMRPCSFSMAARTNSAPLPAPPPDDQSPPSPGRPLAPPPAAPASPGGAQRVRHGVDADDAVHARGKCRRHVAALGHHAPTRDRHVRPMERRRQPERHDCARVVLARHLRHRA